MCVLALAWQAHRRWQLLLIGNRDEFHDRPTAALAPWPDSPSPLLAGRDLRAGGSWLGTDGQGRMAVLTNVRDPTARTGGPSRGALVAGYLQDDQDAARSAAALATGAGAMAPFNLLLADGRQCQYLGNHPSRQQAVPAGIHGLSNAGLNAPWPKSQQLQQALGRWIASDSDSLSALWLALGERRQPRDQDLPDTGVGLALERQLAPVFIAGPQYGTRASHVLAIDADGAGLLAERRFGPDGVALGASHWHFDGRGRFTQASPE